MGRFYLPINVQQVLVAHQEPVHRRRTGGWRGSSRQRQSAKNGSMGILPILKNRADKSVCPTLGHGSSCLSVAPTPVRALVSRCWSFSTRPPCLCYLHNSRLLAQSAKMWRRRPRLRSPRSGESLRGGVCRAEAARASPGHAAEGGRATPFGTSHHSLLLPTNLHHPILSPNPFRRMEP